jgi:hypothetical protein
MGSFIVIIAAILLITLLTSLLALVVKKFDLHVMIVEKLKTKLYYSMFIRSSLTMYIKLTFVALTTIFELPFSNAFEIVSSIFVII